MLVSLFAVCYSLALKGVVAWGDVDSGGDCSWLYDELQDVKVKIWANVRAMVEILRSQWLMRQ